MFTMTHFTLSISIPSNTRTIHSRALTSCRTRGYSWRAPRAPQPKNMREKSRTNYKIQKEKKSNSNSKNNNIMEGHNRQKAASKKESATSINDPLVQRFSCRDD